MKFDRIVLVNPSYSGSHWGAVRPPVGLGYLSEMLTSKDIAHRIIDICPPDYTKWDLFRAVTWLKPDLVGFSMLTFRYIDTYNLIKELKGRFPSIAIVVGGPHVSMCEKKVLEESPHIDYGIIGEGEISLIELCKGVQLDKIGGLIFRNGKEISSNLNTFVDNLDRLPFPRYRRFSLISYVAKEIGIITSRGCPYNCVFCQETLGKKFRMRSAGSVLEEISYWHRKGYRDIIILDDNFTMDEERALEICSGIERANLKGLCIRLANGVRADRINRNLLARMRAAGFRYISFGVEAGSDRVLKSIGKGETIGEIREAISMAIDIGFEVTLFFLVGSPMETRKDVEDSVHLAREFPVFDAKFYNLIPFPHTKLYEWVRENGVFLKEPEQYLNDASHWDNTPVFETPWFSRDERKGALIYTRKVRRGIRIRAIRRRLKRIFPLNWLIAGVFSIGFIQDMLQSNRLIRRTLQDVFHRHRP